MYKIYYFLSCFGLISCLFPEYGIAEPNTPSLYQTKQVGSHRYDSLFDLSSHEFEKDGTASLAGEWEFYWQKFIFPNEFASNNALKPDSLLAVPLSWVSIKINGEV